MHQIKFRAWNTETNEMHDHGLIGGLSLFDISNQLTPTLKFMQYAGLKDKNGNEVYDGDIYIQYAKIDGKLVQLGSGSGESWVIDHKVAEWKTSHNGGAIGFSLPPKPEQRIEVVGNIYQNPELLL